LALTGGGPPDIGGTLSKRINEVVDMPCAPPGDELRQRTEAQLRESEAMMRFIVKHDPNAIAVYDRDLRYIAVSDRYLRDYDVQAADILGRRHYEVFPEMPPRWKEVHRRCLAGAVERNDDDFFERPDGSITHNRWECRPWYRADGTVGGMITYTEVTTERKLAEKALRESNQRLRLATASGNLGVWDWEIAADRLTWDDRMLEIYGLAREAFSGRVEAWRGALHPDDRAEAVAACEAALEGTREFSHEFRILCPDGTAKAIRSDALVMRDPSGRAVRMIGLNRDITARCQALEALQESERKFRRLFNLSSDAVFLIAKDTGRILEVNDAAEGQYGFTRAELTRMRNIDLSAEPEKTRQATAVQAPIIPIRYHRRKDGTVFPVEIAAAHFQWQGQDVHLAAIRDISFRLQAENEKTHLANQLRQAQKMEAIGTLAGGIAHDFNNILALIIGFAELGLEDLHRTTEVRGHLSEILAAGKRARDLVRQILTFSRQSDQTAKPIAVGPIVEEAARMLRSVLPTTIAMVVDIQASESTIKGDATQIHQVLMNLCTNAAQAMEATGGQLSIGLQKVAGDGHTGPDKSPPDARPHLRLRVRDTGPGIAPEHLERIFEPYFSTKGVCKGTGLGLAVVHGIVASHGGRVTVRPEVPGGTCFDVFLPLLEAGPGAIAEAAAGGAPRGREAVLLVDDEAAIVRMQQMVLERLGYRVTTRTSSLEALEAFKAVPGRYDAVITDMTMPGLTGEELAVELRRVRPGIPILICTGYSEQLTDEKVAALGIDAFLMKPVGQADLAAALRGILDRRKPPAG
jgi:PAS domain S-box-containing protein